MSEATEHTKHLPAHEATYASFVKVSGAVCIYCAFLLVALCSFAFAATLPSFLGFAGLAAGAMTLAVDFRAGGRWVWSGGALVLFALTTGVNMS